MKIGFIGLGQMGRAMAARLLDAGHELTVYNRSRAAIEAFGDRGATLASEAAETLDAEVVVTMLADDAAVEAVWLTAGLVAKMPASCVHLNMATISANGARQLTAQHRAAGSEYVSAPVFGRPPAAAQGQLDIVAAGSEPALARCRPLFEVLGRQSFVVGTEPYQANIAKIARNFLLATVIESLGEAFALVRKSGLDPGLFLDVLTCTSFSAPVYRNYGRMIVEQAFEPATFALRLGLKDVELALEAGGDSQVPMPMAALIREQHLGALAGGFGEKDWASLAQYIAQRAGL
jgi:3-hydroxyisobutyrate dehydrogenase-like beta-hydroxyacid dehydrogenase